jgi:hypothetical protein
MLRALRIITKDALSDAGKLDQGLKKLVSPGNGAVERSPYSFSELNQYLESWQKNPARYE